MIGLRGFRSALSSALLAEENSAPHPFTQSLIRRLEDHDAEILALSVIPPLPRQSNLPAILPFVAGELLVPIRARCMSHLPMRRCAFVVLPFRDKGNYGTHNYCSRQPFDLRTMFWNLAVLGLGWSISIESIDHRIGTVFALFALVVLGSFGRRTR
jgi:hypothetical protein